MIGLDACNIPRPESPTARDRTYLHLHNLPEGEAAITYGWQFSNLVVLPSPNSSWDYPLDNQRIESHQTPAEVGAQQLKEIVPLLPRRPFLVAERYYGSAIFVALICKLALDALLRIKSDRVFYRKTPPPTGKRGAPRKDGAIFKCKDPTTQGKPDRSWQEVDQQGKTVLVECWDGLHFKKARDVEVSVIRVTREGARNKKRDPKVSWLGEETALPLSEVLPRYRSRYGIEHGFRFAKQDLLWTKAHLRTPEQFQRWTDLVAAVKAELVIARPSVEADYRPWETKERAATPQQVRRGLGRIISELGTPAGEPKGRGKSNGRAKGDSGTPAKFYEVVYKGTGRGKKE
jgi:hypothetical protein